jgi:type VI secretion system secreted protein VgrG
VGQTDHSLNFQRRVNDVDLFEVFDYPAGFGVRVDSVGRNRADQAGNLADLSLLAERCAKLRRDEVTARALVIRATSDYPHFRPGFRFRLTERFDADPNQPIGLLLTRVEHEATIEGAYVAADDAKLVYTNRFECLPEGITFRPQRRTPRPRIDGLHTATVVGPAGEEIFLDKYGRVKLKFHWDRQRGPGSPDSSCWVRVAQVWAGRMWGAFFWPRIGHEVIVAFEGGNPNRPLIVGSVYNAQNMPPLALPGSAYLNGIKSCLAGGDPAVAFNAVVFHDRQADGYVDLRSFHTQIDNSLAAKFQYVPKGNISFNGEFF